MSNSKDVTFRYDEDELDEIKETTKEYLEQRRREKAAKKKKKKAKKKLEEKVGKRVNSDDLPIKLQFAQDGGKKITISRFKSKSRAVIQEDKLEQNKELLKAYREIQDSFAERTEYEQFQVTASG